MELAGKLDDGTSFTYWTFNKKVPGPMLRARVGDTIAVGLLTKEHKLKAKVGETVRLYFGVGGPNKISSFHVIGEIFDKVYREGSVSAPARDIQTTLVPPGGAAIVEMKLEYPGQYLLVDHALSRAGKGLVGVMEVTGSKDAGIYKQGSDH